MKKILTTLVAFGFMASSFSLAAAQVINCAPGSEITPGGGCSSAPPNQLISGEPTSTDSSTLVAQPGDSVSSLQSLLNLLLQELALLEQEYTALTGQQAPTSTLPVISVVPTPTSTLPNSGASVPTIFSMAPSSVPLGGQVVVAGTDFVAGDYVVLDGNLAQPILPGAITTYLSPSGNTMSLTFTVPTTVIVGPHMVQVGTGTTLSNALPLTVTASSVQVPTSTNLGAAPAIFSINPSGGPAGTLVALTGSGFAASGNTVQMSSSGQARTVSDLSSNDGSTLMFIVPTTGSSCPSGIECNVPVLVPGTYGITVTNTNGTSNAQGFILTAPGTAPTSTVTLPTTTITVAPLTVHPPTTVIMPGTAPATIAVPVVVSVAPSSVAPGSTVTVNGTSFASGDYIVVDGNAGQHVSPTTAITAAGGNVSSFSFVALSTMAAGSHVIQVSNGTATSNAVSLTIIAPTVVPPTAGVTPPKPVAGIMTTSTAVSTSTAWNPAYP